MWRIPLLGKLLLSNYILMVHMCMLSSDIIEPLSTHLQISFIMSAHSYMYNAYIILLWLNQMHRHNMVEMGELSNAALEDVYLVKVMVGSS